MGLRGLFSNPPKPLAGLLYFFDVLDEKPKRRRRRS
jgi:hypothetical protein